MKRPMIEDNGKGFCGFQLTKKYGKKTAVDSVSISVNLGEIVGLLGPNGAGKTTSFYLMVGLIRPDSGNIFMDQTLLNRYPMYRRAQMGIGYLPQEPSTFRKLTVIENLQAIAETLPLNRKQRNHRVQESLEELDLNKIAKQKAYTLSGGERRRLEISRALITQPAYLLLDEPFSGVDPISVAEVQTIIRKLSEKNIGILITDHNVRETLSIVHRAYIMDQGKVLLEGNREFLTNHPVARKRYLGEYFTM